jgi:hypothetical protein
MGASKSGKGFGEMNWVGKYVIDPSGMIFWREGMLVHNQELVAAFERSPIVGLTLGMCSEFGVNIGEA